MNHIKDQSLLEGIVLTSSDVVREWRSKIMKTSLLSIFASVAAIATFSVASSAKADTYNVSRSFSDGGGTATLVGTVDAALGNYTIMNGAPNPFTNVNLTLTVNGTPFILDHANTSLIFGSGQFFIDATAASLIFNTANADGNNPADLRFFDSLNSNFYSIGSDAKPGFEIGSTSAGEVSADVTFPVVFGTAVPEASTSILAVLGAGLLGLGLTRQRSSRSGRA